MSFKGAAAGQVTSPSRPAPRCRSCPTGDGRRPLSSLARLSAGRFLPHLGSLDSQLRPSLSFQWPNHYTAFMRAWIKHRAPLRLRVTHDSADLHPASPPPHTH